jgi:outer membrane PBP1 activator LpoA protein
MNGHVFQCFNESADPNQFEKTVEVLGKYAAKNFKHAGDLELLFRNLSMRTVEQPTELDKKTATKADIKVYDKELDIYVVRKTKLKDNVKALYAVAWGQCSDAMKAKIKRQISTKRSVMLVMSAGSSRRYAE